VGAGAFDSLAQGAGVLAKPRAPAEPIASHREAYEIAYRRWLAHREIPKA
jgi:hypothetical protein